MEMGVVDDNYSLEGEIDRKIIIEKLKLLAPRDAELLTMKYLQEMSYTEMSQALEEEEGALRTATHRAAAKLANLIKPHAHE